MQPGSISGAGIKVRGAVVMNKNNELVPKDTNKTYKSTRGIPIMIPRILEVLPEGEEWTPYIRILSQAKSSRYAPMPVFRSSPVMACAARSAAWRIISAGTK